MANPGLAFRASCWSLLALAALLQPVLAANCNVTSVNRTPINDLGAGLYLNQYQGGLYPGGSNVVPATHAAEGAARAQLVEPLNVQGRPSATGKYVLLSIGMSNTTQEFSKFMQLAASSPNVNHSKLVIVDGAAGGQTAGTWDQPTDQNYDRIRDQELAPLGLTEAQVQAAWVKVANAQPSVALPNASAEAFILLAQMGNIARALQIRYPNIKLVFFSSRIYAGYASTTLNPEPYAYEYGFAVKWLIQAQIDQMNGGGVHPIAGSLDYSSGGPAPWIAWGPYLWADGLNPRSDGLIWQCSDLANDGTHPSETGRTKVANLLLNHFLNSPFTETWFRGVAGDATGDGSVDINDLLAVIGAWGPCPAPCPPNCAADVDLNCMVNINDLLLVIGNWGGS